MYTKPGMYTVSLSIDGPGGTDIEIKRDCITVSIPAPVPVAIFSTLKTNGIIPMEVRFENHSTGVITSCKWNFGDGETSSEKKPIHIYNISGTYTVTLETTGPGGSDIEVKHNYIVAKTPAPTSIESTPKELPHKQTTKPEKNSNEKIWIGLAVFATVGGWLIDRFRRRSKSS
jgi:PKD repeat protein